MDVESARGGLAAGIAGPRSWGPGGDIRSNLARCAGIDLPALDATLAALDPPDRAEFCRLIRRDLECLAAGLKADVLRARGEAVRRAGHQIKALAATVGAEGLSRAAEDLGLATRRDRDADAEVLVREIERRTVHVCRFFGALQEEVGRAVTS